MQVSFIQTFIYDNLTIIRLNLSNLLDRSRAGMLRVRNIPARDQSICIQNIIYLAGKGSQYLIAINWFQCFRPNELIGIAILSNQLSINWAII